jgi:MFS family permease
VIVAAFVVISIAMYGIRFSFGIFLKSLDAEFALGRTLTSAVFSAYWIIGVALVVIGGWASDRYGARAVLLVMGFLTGLILLLTSRIDAPWQLFISYSLLLAVGNSAIFVVTMATVSRWFDRRRGLALGVVGAGLGAGPAVAAPFATMLNTAYGWRAAFGVMGLLAWLVVLLATVLASLVRREAVAA